MRKQSVQIKDFDLVVNDITSGNKKFKTNDYLIHGEFPIIDQGSEYIAGFTNEDKVVQRNKDVIVFGDHTKNLKYVDFDFCLGADGTKVLEPKDGLDTKYLYYFLRTRKIPNVGYSRHFKYLKRTQIPLPPIETQKSIAARLDQAEAVKQLNQQLLAKYDELAQSLFLEMFGEYINNKKTSLSDLIKINPRKSELKITNENLKVSFIPMSNVGEKGEFDTTEIREYGEVNKGYTYFKENDVLFAKITPCMENGKGAIAKNLKNQIGFGSTEFHVLRPNENLNSQFLYYLLALDSVRKFAEMNMTGSAGQKRVPTDFFQKMKLSKPPLSLQTEFAHRIENIEHQKSLLRLEIAKSEELFESLLQESFDFNKPAVTV